MKEKFWKVEPTVTFSLQFKLNWIRFYYFAHFGEKRK